MQRVTVIFLMNCHLPYPHQQTVFPPAVEPLEWSGRSGKADAQTQPRSAPLTPGRSASPTHTRCPGAGWTLPPAQLPIFHPVLWSGEIPPPTADTERDRQTDLPVKQQNNHPNTESHSRTPSALADGNSVLLPPCLHPEIQDGQCEPAMMSTTASCKLYLKEFEKTNGRDSVSKKPNTSVKICSLNWSLLYFQGVTHTALVKLTVEFTLRSNDFTNTVICITVVQALTPIKPNKIWSQPLRSCS